ncbi:Mu transposase C-terminal domain-containing protein [Anabaena sp. CCY 9402-a]|uniref:Mu transposase C-terminal domain-containing protein n=1 Tax=Anabaena sp. CCY 9402-a TaxID=3103867 RepID=UPI0039C5EB0E
MKEAQRVVQAHGSIQFENLIYRGESLKAYRGEFVTLRYDPDHILTLYIYSCETNDNLEDFLGYAVHYIIIVHFKEFVSSLH